MWNIVVGMMCLFVAYDSNQDDRYSAFFVPVGLVLGIFNVGVGIMTIVS